MAFRQFPVWEYEEFKEKPQKLDVTYDFLLEMPGELKHLKEFFWDNLESLKPVHEQNFNYPGGILNHKNWFNCDIVEGFIDSRNQGWVLIDFNREGISQWWLNEEAAEEMPTQLMFKILYGGWIFKDKYWWRVTLIGKRFYVPEVIDLTVEIKQEIKVEEVYI